MYINAKMILVETIPGMVGDKGGVQWRGQIQVWYI
jgi:hypothetical protein